MTSATLGAGHTAGRGLRARTTSAVLAWVAAAALLEMAAAPRVWLLVVVAPVLEEAALRAGLHEALLARRWSPTATNLLTALTFAALHMAVQGSWQGALVAGPALLIGAAYNRWRQLRWCVLLHAAMNAAWLAVMLVNRAA
jgi:membrane protease YdiL (CAAX protease family)